MSSPIINIIRFVILIMTQLLIINNIRLGNYVHPCLYVLFIMILPLDMPKLKVLLWGFITGLTIDLFMGTLGLNAAATTFMAFMRPSVIKLATGGHTIEGSNSITSLGNAWLIRYTTVLLILHNFLLFFLETFNLRLFGETMLRSIISIIISEILILLILIFFKPTKKSL